MTSTITRELETISFSEWLERQSWDEDDNILISEDGFYCCAVPFVAPNLCRDCIHFCPASQFQTRFLNPGTIINRPSHCGAKSKVDVFAGGYVAPTDPVCSLFESAAAAEF